MANDDVMTVMQNVDGGIMKTHRLLRIQRNHCHLITVLHQIMTLIMTIYAN